MMAFANTSDMYRAIVNLQIVFQIVLLHAKHLRIERSWTLNVTIFGHGQGIGPTSCRCSAVAILSLGSA